MQNKFINDIKIHQESYNSNKKKFQSIGIVKVLLFILFVICIYQLYNKGITTAYLAATPILLVTQILFWIYHNKIQTEMDYAKGIISLNEKNIARITGDWKHFKDQGEEYMDVDHPYGNDLDIVGKKSLFQFLNTTNTYHGRKAFKDAMLHRSFSPNEVLSRQKAIVELSKDFVFLNNIWYYFSKIGISHNISEFIQELQSNRPFLKHKILKPILMRLPIVTCILLGLSLLFPQLRILLPISVGFVFLQMVIWLVGVPSIHNYLMRTSGHTFKLNPYCTIIDIIEQQEFQSEKLKEVQNILSASDVSAKKAIKELNKINDRLSARHNSILYFVLNILLLWDYECIILMENWKNAYAPYCEEWFTALGEFESLTCFANMPDVCALTCIPEISDGKKITANELGHPLIMNEDRVTNSMNFNNDIFIISGSNMSGKTTFLRTVGINLILAKCGSFVCADKLEFSLFQIVTSMRIADDLNEGISTFYAELKRIKHIIDAAKMDSNTLFLIDEIFRGTNSADRLSGARTVAAKLHSFGVSGMITTHDLELCSLESQYARMHNFNFRETYEDKKIKFDYKMRSGKSQTTNAKFLMELVGIL